jgi:hypothetical protein
LPTLLLGCGCLVRLVVGSTNKADTDKIGQ